MSAISHNREEASQALMQAMTDVLAAGPVPPKTARPEKFHYHSVEEPLHILLHCVSDFKTGLIATAMSLTTIAITFVMTGSLFAAIFLGVLLVPSVAVGMFVAILPFDLIDVRKYRHECDITGWHRYDIQHQAWCRSDSFKQLDIQVHAHNERWMVDFWDKTVERSRYQ